MDFGVELGLNTRLPYFSRAALRSATIFCSPTLRVSVFFDKPDFWKLRRHHGRRTGRFKGEEYANTRCIVCICGWTVYIWAL